MTARASAGSPGADLPVVTVLSTRRAYLLAGATGVLYFLAFPGVGAWPLALVAFAPLLVALRGQTPAGATALGWVAGLVATMAGFYWLLEMLRAYSGFGTPLCILFLALLCAYQGGRIAVCAWLFVRAGARGWPAAPAFALAFAASEVAYPLLFPWYFGASVHDVPLLLQAADLGGPIVVSLVLLGPNLALAELAAARLERRAPTRAVLSAGVLVPALAAAYGAYRIAAVEAAMRDGKSLRVGVVQPNLKLFGRADTVALHLRMTQELRDRGAELVVWSEAAVARAFDEETHARDVPHHLTRHLGVPTIVGTVLHRAAATEGGRDAYFNTALLAGDDGAVLGRYDKQFLLAFGEYLPFGDVFPILYEWSPSSGRFSPGTTIEPLRWGEHAITTLICYEDILPWFVNRLVAHGDPDLLVNLTNDTWFGDTTEPWIHLALAKLRSVEHHRYLVRATNTGVSAIVDPLGRIVVRGGTYREETLLADVRFLRARSLYGVVGDAPWWLATAAILAMGFVERRRGRRP